MTAAELMVGVELADAKRKPARRRFVEAILSQIPIEIYDLDVARAHSLLLAMTHKAGRREGLMI